MNFLNENRAINGLADYIIKSGVCLFNTIKYIYSIGDSDFYNVNIKDVLKIMINTMPNSEAISSLGLRIDGKSCSQMSGDDYNKVLPLIAYSLAVRIPVLKTVKSDNTPLTDDQLYKIYTAVLEKGAENYMDSISETFLETKYLVRKGKTLPPYTAEWYKSYIFKAVPALSEMTNKNIFLYGAVDMLFAMFYSVASEGLAAKLLEFADGSEELLENEEN